MASKTLKQKIYDSLKSGYFSESTDLVDVSDGFDDLVHVVIVSRKFDGKLARERHNLIWSELTKQLSDEDMYPYLLGQVLRTLKPCSNPYLFPQPGTINNSRCGARIIKGAR